MTQPVVFLGPSLERTVAAAHMNAEFRPPIRRGDLPGAVRQGARSIGIIDGEFGQSLAVSVMELRSALRQGVRIWGAASMGALRAVECRGLGMVGVGWIFERYADGTFASDDEVALAFDPRSGRATSIPLVNVRWAIELCVDAGVLPCDSSGPLTGLARGVPFAERSAETLLEAASGTGHEAAMGALVDFIGANPLRCDRKRLDALALLDCLARG